MHKEEQYKNSCNHTESRWTLLNYSFNLSVLIDGTQGSSTKTSAPVTGLLNMCILICWTLDAQRSADNVTTRVGMGKDRPHRPKEHRPSFPTSGTEAEISKDNNGGN